MGFRIVLSSVLLCLTQLRALLACLVIPLMLGLFFASLLMTMVAGSAWLYPPFWVLAMNGFVRYLPLLMIGVAALLLLAQSAFAVGWHRFLLQDERPNVLRMPSADLVVKYLFLSFLLSFAYLIIAYFVSVFAGLLLQLLPFSSSGGFGTILITVVGVFLTYIMLRLALILPACSVERDMTLHESWEQTGRVNGAVAEIAVVLTMLSIALDILFGFLPLGWYGMAVVFMLTGLIMSLLTVTALGLLYGALVEGRPLPV